MTKLTSMPIPTTDNWASEDREGLSSPLCADVAGFSGYTSGSWYADSSGTVLSGVDLISGIIQPPSAMISGYTNISGNFISGYYTPTGDFPSGNFISGIDITATLSYYTSSNYDVQPSSGYVVSEYGIRKGLDDYINTSVTGTNLGVGEQVFVKVEDSDVKIKTIDTQYPNRVILTTDGGVIDFNYDGRGQSIVPQVSSMYVQGGSQQIWGMFPSLSGFDTIVLKEGSYHYGYWIGGYTTSNSNAIYWVDKYDMTNDTNNTTPTTNLQEPDYIMGVIWNKTAFYAGDGDRGGASTKYFNKYIFSTAVMSLIVSLSYPDHSSYNYTNGWNDKQFAFGYTVNMYHLIKTNMAAETNSVSTANKVALNQLNRGATGRDSVYGYRVNAGPADRSKKYNMSTDTWILLGQSGTSRAGTGQSGYTYDDFKCWCLMYENSTYYRVCTIYTYATNTQYVRPTQIPYDASKGTDTRSIGVIRSGTFAQGIDAYHCFGESNRNKIYKFSLINDTDAGVYRALSRGREDSPAGAMS